MVKVSFRTKDGKLVSFQDTGKRKRGRPKRKLSEYNRFMKARLPPLNKKNPKGIKNHANFRQIAAEWRAKKRK